MQMPSRIQNGRFLLHRYGIMTEFLYYYIYYFTTDIDECQENLDNCVKKKSRCLNTPGSFKCMDIGCKEDYKLVQRNGEK